MAAAVSIPGPAGAGPMGAAPRRKAMPLRLVFLLACHAVISGGFVVAWCSGDEDTYLMHLLAGYAVLSAVAVRLAVGWAGWLRPANGARRPRWLDWQATGLLTVIALTGVSGVAADFWSIFEDLHETLANLALAAVLAHVAVTLARAALRRMR